MFLFDTNILSEVLKKKPSTALLKQLAGIPGHQQATSCICVMEMRYGAQRRPDHDVFWERIQNEVLSSLNILPITRDIAVLAGDVAAYLSLNGFGIPLRIF